MKLFATFAACALAAAALVGCETTEETTSVAPGAVAGETCGSGSCCGSCGDKAEVAPGAMSEGACGAAKSCGEAESCGESPVTMGAVKEDCASACGAAKAGCSGM